MPRWTRVGLLVVLALGLRLYHLGHENFWIDEVQQVQVASQSIEAILRNYSPTADPRLYQQAPLSLIITHLFLLPSASPEWAARLPSVIFGVGSVLALYLVAGELSAAPVPLLAALFLTASPLHVWYSQEARWYAPWVFFSMLSYLALLRAWRSERVRHWVSYAALTLLNLYTFILSFAVIGCQALSVWGLHRLRGRRRRFVSWFLAAQVIVLACVLPVLAIVATYLKPQLANARPTTLAALPFTLFAFAGGFSLGPTTADLHTGAVGPLILAAYPVVAIVFAIFIPLLLLGVRRAWRNPPAGTILLPWLCGPVVLAFGLALLTNINFRVRYALVALPAFVMLVALGVESVKRARLRWAMIGAVLACSVWSLGNSYWNSSYAKEDVRGALAYVRAAGTNASPVLTVGEIHAAAAYYGRGMPVRELKRCDVKPQEHDSIRLGAESEAAVLWVVVGRDWNRQAPLCLDRLLQSHAAVEHQHFPGVDLWRLQRRSG